ncbi:MAG TPA: choice-of-anchor D domain-containing protein [Prosthecobacter sp.]
MRTLFPLLCLLLCAAAFLRAAPGDLDPGYQPLVYADLNTPALYAASVREDGGVAVGGTVLAVRTQSTSGLEIVYDLTAEGNFAPSFDTPSLNLGVQSMVRQWDGKMLVAGPNWFIPNTGFPYPGIRRINPNGSVDESFAPAISGGTVEMMAVQPDGEIIIAGSFQALNGVARSGIARLHSDGLLDEEFEVSVSGGQIYTLATTPDGSILVGGDFTAVNGVSRKSLAKLNADGTLDANFTANVTKTGGLSGRVHCVVVHPDGSLTVGGLFDSVNGQYSPNLVRLAENGGFSKGLSVNAVVRTAALQADGKLWVGGDFQFSLNGQERKKLMRLMPDGSLDLFKPAAFVSDSLSLDLQSLALQGDGRVLAGGAPRSDYSKSMPAPRLLYRYENDSTTDKLEVTGGTRLQWLRGGSTPEALEVRFEVSENGSDWQLLGAGSRMAGGWELNGLSLPESGFVRARARTCGGYRNGSYGLVGRTISLGNGTAEITLVAPDGISHSDSLGTYDFGQNYSVRTFKIRNSGAAVLRLDGITFRDVAGASVSAGSQTMKRELQPGEETEFTVFMDPHYPFQMQNLAAGMTIASNAGNNPKLSLSLTGQYAATSTPQLHYLAAFGWNGGPAFSDYLPFERRFFPERTVYSLPIASDLMRASISVGLHPDMPYRYRVNGNVIEWQSAFDVEFLPVPKPIVLEVQSPDGQTWTTYTIHVYRRAPKPGAVELASEFAHLQYPEAILPDGKILSRSLRWNASGTIDALFPDFFSQEGSILVQPDLSMLLVRSSLGLLRLGNNGTTLGRSPAAKDFRTFVKLKDGTFLGSNYSAQLLIKLSADGSLDTQYISPVRGSIECLVELPDGRTLIGGAFEATFGNPASRGVARLNVDGTLDESYPIVPVTGRVSGMIRQPDGKVIICGIFSKVADASHTGLARLNEDGTVDETFRSAWGYSDQRSGVALQADGKILLAGNFSFNQYPGLVLVRLNPDGTWDRSLRTQTPSGSVQNLVLEKNGSILIGGNFASINYVPRSGGARLHNDPATENLAVPTPSSILWERGGTAPEALSVYFECSTDAGSSWTLLGDGTYVGGGWALEGLHLPPAGKVRARAVLQSGTHNRGRGLIETVTEFSFAPPVMALEDASGHPWVSGGTADFGQVGLSGLRTQTFLMRNTGPTRLEGIRVEIDGPEAADFRLEKPAAVVLPAGNSQSLTFQFNPLKLGSRTAVAKIYSSTPESGPVQILLTGTGIKAAGAAPVVKTLAATGLSTVSAVLNGTVNAKGLPRQVFFEYGTSQADLGKIVPAAPALAEGSAVIPAQASLSGLLPKTRYYYRVRAASAEGGIAGGVQSFVTGNRAPVARHDRFIVAAGAEGITLNVLANDEDADGDLLTLASVSAPEPEYPGTLVVVGNAVVFTPAQNAGYYSFSFTYQIKDAAGALSESAQVQVRSASAFSFSPLVSGQVSAAGKSYTLTLTTYASWKVTNPLPWVTVDVMEGFGDKRLLITVLPNGTTKARSGVLKIGGLTHEITQDGVQLPVLEQPGLPLRQAYVAAVFELPIPTQNLPVTYTVKNLPPGLTISGTTGVISGVPSRPGKYAISIKARNVAGAAVDTVLFDLDVSELPREFQGRHEGVITLSDTRPRSLGGRYDLTVTATGAFTGKVTHGTKTESLKGSLAVDPVQPSRAVGTATLPGKTPLREFKFELHADGDGSHNTQLLEGGVQTDAGNGWRIPWNGKDQVATVYAKDYSFVTSPLPSAGSGPQGHGYGTFTVAGKTGAVKIVGRLADGTPYLYSSFVSATGDIALYQSLYSKGGVLVGALAVGIQENPEENHVFGNMDWVKYPVDAASKELSYREGINSMGLSIRGGVLPKLAPGGRILNLPESSSQQAELKFSGGGVPTSFNAAVTVTNLSAKGMTNKATVSATPQAVLLPQLDAKKGSFSGSFTLTGSTAALNRKTAFSGQIVQIDGAVRGYGFFMLPELPAEGGSLKKSPQHSGAVLFQAAPPP